MESNIFNSAEGPVIRSVVSHISAEFALNKRLEATVSELQVFQDRLSGVMLAGDIAWWQMYPDTGKIVFSENKARMLGYPPEKFTHYIDFTSLVHPDDHEKIMEKMRACILGEDLYKVDYRICGNDGEYIWFSDVVMISSRNDQGEPAVISGIVTNINERIQDKLAAQENARKLRLLFDFIPMGLSIADGEGRIVNANRAVSRILGLDVETQRQRSIDGQEWTLIRRDGTVMPSDEYASVRALRENRLIENVEMGLVKGAGDPVRLLANATTTDIPGLDLVISYLDTTALVSKELELEQSQKKLRLFLDNIPQPVIITDPKGVILDVNTAVCHFYGFSREEALGKPVYYIALPIDISHQKLAEKQSKIDMYRTLAGLSELRDNETGHHMRRVGLYTRHLAKKLEQTVKYCEEIEVSAPMHDIGKVGISDSILLAPRKLTPDEFREIETPYLAGSCHSGWKGRVGHGCGNHPFPPRMVRRHGVSVRPEGGGHSPVCPNNRHCGHL